MRSTLPGLTSVLVKQSVQLLPVHGWLGRLHEVSDGVLVEVVGGHVQPPLILAEAVDGRVLVSARDGDKLPHFGAL